MNMLVSLLMKFGILNKALFPLTWVWSKARGVRTELIMAIAALVYAAGFFGIIDMAQAKEIAFGLLSAGAPTLLSKIERYSPLAEKASAKIGELASK